QSGAPRGLGDEVAAGEDGAVRAGPVQQGGVEAGRASFHGDPGDEQGRVGGQRGLDGGQVPVDRGEPFVPLLEFAGFGEVRFRFDLFLVVERVGVSGEPQGDLEVAGDPVHGAGAVDKLVADRFRGGRVEVQVGEVFQVDHAEGDPVPRFAGQPGGAAQVAVDPSVAACGGQGSARPDGESGPAVGAHRVAEQSYPRA